MGPSSPDISAKIPAHPVRAGYEVRKSRLETTKETPDTRTVEDSLEKLRE